MDSKLVSLHLEGLCFLSPVSATPLPTKSHSHLSSPRSSLYFGAFAGSVPPTGYIFPPISPHSLLLVILQVLTPTSELLSLALCLNSSAAFSVSFPCSCHKNLRFRRSVRLFHRCLTHWNVSFLRPMFYSSLYPKAEQRTLIEGLPQ